MKIGPGSVFEVLGYVGVRERATWLAKLKNLGGTRMTRGVIGRVVLGIWLGCVTSAAAQLPPDMQVDRYLVQIQRLVEEKDNGSARDVLYKIVALQREHGLTLPEEFHFRHAQVAFSVGSLNVAKDSVEKYLKEAGRDGEFYREVLELLDEVEQRSLSRKEAPRCPGQFKGAECWMAVTGQSECYTWNESLEPGATVTWTGDAQVGLGWRGEDFRINRKPPGRQEVR